MKLTLVRPLVYRVMTPVLLLALVVFIGSVLLLYTVSDVLRVSLAILFGMWGVRKVITPIDIPWPLRIDVGFLLLYVVFFAVALFKIICLALRGVPGPA